MQGWAVLAVGVAVLVGLAGVVVPVLPGLLLVWAAVALWCVVEGGAAAWVLLGAGTVVAVGSQVLKYVVPGRRLQQSGVPRSSLVTASVAAVVGFFVVPVVGLFVGFVLGMYAAERRRLGGHDASWASTRLALRAVGLSVLIELAAALLVATGWVGVLLAA